MKKPLSQRLLRATTVAGCLSLVAGSVSSCETTGDPSTGGIFWSEAKAKQRIAEREQRLDQLEGKTSHTKASSRQKQAQIDELQQ